MATKIPVTVVTGFLGSGKTTLMRHLLQNNQGRRIAVLVNEFGELGIDGELLKSCQVCPEETSDNLGVGTEDLPQIVELTNGCLCCTVQEEFLPTMLELLKRRDSIDCITIETSGLALPKPLVKAFRWHEIRNAATVDAVVTVVDCAAVAAGTFASNPQAIELQRQADESLEHETPLQELFEDQLACADLVVLNKTDLIDATTQAEVLKLVQQELPRQVKMVTSDRGQIDPTILLGFQAAAEDDLSNRPSHHDTEEDHEHEEEITSTHVVLNRTFEPNALQNQLQVLAKEQDIYRIKGFVAVANKPMRLVLQGVGTRFDQFYDRLWQPEEMPQTRLVFIGRSLNPTTIESQLVTLPG
ncbi:MAG: P-loop guanosine triphosphatase YjiA [Chroococcidiopsis sp. SAG 2025]|uniref:cobalamin biosynthesis protein CobW n=1 Tax=Chroococcidiopsis sp. SAG 2025 TaxID=171389 RepID=UPI00293714A6|nr:cobalamin biosynthesis protein CobW [Chroococcidiopsis sp. SAG 2025]MDV2993002.1 P-loop guanosine triphosphatase YjiA [Chroococcidiopsis sp. SAG 2025]